MTFLSDASRRRVAFLFSFLAFRFIATFFAFERNALSPTFSAFPARERFFGGAVFPFGFYSVKRKKKFHVLSLYATSVKRNFRSFRRRSRRPAPTR